MGTFIRAVVTGFGFNLGTLLYKKVSKRLGLDEDSSAKPPPDAAAAAGEDSAGDGESDPDADPGASPEPERP